MTMRRVQIPAAERTFQKNAFSGMFPARNQHTVARWLLQWLADRETEILPRMRVIAGFCPEPVHSTRIDTELRWLVKEGLITRRTGGRRELRGHAAIRVVASGRVFKTSGCPFEPPESTHE